MNNISKLNNIFSHIEKNVNFFIIWTSYQNNRETVQK